MANTLSVAPHAEADLREAFQWYEARSAGLGPEFLRCIEARLHLITRVPRIFRLRGPLHRLARIDRFPYAIYFVWEEERAHVAVRRVLHFAQDASRAFPKP
jgi:plasmid stabilization system protein ParE